MKLLWLCNMAPGMVQEKMGGKSGSGLWMDHVLADLSGEDITLHILFRGEQAVRGAVSERITYCSFMEPKPYVYLPELETLFYEELDRFAPDIIHIWGTEYGHTLAMMRGAERAGMKNRAVISIQGLCSVCAVHYTEGLPASVLKRTTFRDFLRQDNILQQRKKFALRGEMEISALRMASHVMGRTQWDRACTYRINPAASYHVCRETLREPFYQGQWRYEHCRKHRIFASSYDYPIKGFHYLLEAFGEVAKRWPDATLAVPGAGFLNCTGKARLRQQTYHRYLAELARKYGVEDKIEFLGGLSAEAMRQAFLDANVFVLSSTVENSPNSLGEAMLLGVPCVSADVGGVSSMLTHEKEGYLYPSSAPYMLAYDIDRIFREQERAEELGQAARLRAEQTHNPEANFKKLMDIYQKIAFSKE